MKHSVSLIILLTLCLSVTAFAENLLDVRYLESYDGDTIYVDIPYVPAVFGERIGVRLRGIDTPELRGGCKGVKDEKTQAIQAKTILNAMIMGSNRLDLRNVGRDKYFRIEADVYADHVNLNEAMLKTGLAVPYDGGTKAKDWCK